jgi:AAA15 family ATPase/GTPase
LEHFVKNIEITNFKSIRHAEVKDCRRVNVFVGYPNVGKSNILEALSLGSFLKDRKSEKEVLLNKLCRVNSFTELFSDGNIDDPVDITFQKSLSILLKYKSESSLIYKAMVIDNIEENVWNDGWNIEFVKGGQSIRSEKNFTQEEFESFTQDPKLHPTIKKYQFLKNKFKERDLITSLSYPDGDNLFSVVEFNKVLRNEVVKLFENYNLKLSFDRSSNSLKIIKELERNVIYLIPFSQIADTLQRLIFYKAAIISNKNTVLLLEEPESHMFPPYISKMTGDITYDENNNQFFIATHSPYVLGDLIRDVEPEELSVYIVGYDATKGETTIHRMNEEEVNEAYQFGHDFFMSIDNFIPKEHEQF